MTGEYRFGRYVPAEQIPPEPEQVTDQVIQRFEHVFEVDPERMGTHFRQQKMPTWDTKRIVAARWDHLDAVHREFADEVLLAGEGPDPGPAAVTTTTERP
jgi:hypothetical protein